MKRTTKLGAKQRAALRFYSRVQSGTGWHTYAADVRGVIESLARRGLLETNEFYQARLTEYGRRVTYETI